MLLTVVVVPNVTNTYDSDRVGRKKYSSFIQKYIPLSTIVQSQEKNNNRLRFGENNFE